MSLLQRTARQVADAVGRESALVKHARPLYERTLAAVAGGRGMTWTINGEPFRISPQHRHRIGRVYDPEVAAWLSGHVRPGAVCLDVGANIGVYALQFARWTGAAGRVVAFEPNPVSARALREHVAMNGFTPVVRVVEAAVSNTAGTQVLHMHDADGMSRLGAPNPEIAALTRAASVQVVTLDAFCRDEGLRPDWILVDVEGFEFSVLAGARETITAGRAPALVVEMHPDAWAVAGWTRASGEALLRELGLEIRSLTGAVDPLDDYGHVLLARPAADNDR